MRSQAKSGSFDSMICRGVITKMDQTTKMMYRLSRHTTLLAIVALIVVSVYYLSSTLELLKNLVEHIEEAERLHAKHNATNSTLAKIMFDPFVNGAHETYNKNELNAIVNIVTYSLLVATSIGGLTATLRKSSLLMMIYGILLDGIYCSTFLYISRVKPHISAYIVLVSILVFLHARQIQNNRMSLSSANKVRLHETNSNQQLIKEQFEHANEIV